MDEDMLTDFCDAEHTPSDSMRRVPTPLPSSLSSYRELRSSGVNSVAAPDIAKVIEDTNCGISCTVTDKTRLVVAKIETVFEVLAQSMLNKEEKLIISLKRKPPVLKGDISLSTNLRYRDISFPGKTPAEAWRFTVLVRILELLHEALVTGAACSKRDIYYKDPALFNKQSVVDRYVDELAFTFEVPRSSLNVVAAAKGLFAGAFKINRADGTTIDGRKDREGTLVPLLSTDETIDSRAVKWILVIEKEAVFRSVVGSEFWELLIARGVLVTGKGYPDVATRAALKRLASSCEVEAGLDVPTYALVDYDPDGIGILSTYKHGSMALAHEHDALRVPQIQWLGLRSRDIAGVNGHRQSQDLLQLSARDRRKAINMLQWSHITESGPETQWRRELQVMLMLNVKAEIELLDGLPGNVHGWLRTHLIP